MSSTNDITGDKIQTRPSTDAYRNSPFWDKRKEQKDGKPKEGEPSKDNMAGR